MHLLCACVYGCFRSRQVGPCSPFTVHSQSIVMAVHFCCININWTISYTLFAIFLTTHTHFYSTPEIRSIAELRWDEMDVCNYFSYDRDKNIQVHYSLSCFTCFFFLLLMNHSIQMRSENNIHAYWKSERDDATGYRLMLNVKKCLLL